MNVVIGIPHSPEAQTQDASVAAAREQARAELRQSIAEQSAVIREQAQLAREQALVAGSQFRTTVAVGQGQGGTSIGFPVPPAAQDIPPRVKDVSMMALVLFAVVVVTWPITRSLARWIDRRQAPRTVPTELSAQLSRMETAIEAMQIEVERIAESQRFMARIVAEDRREALPAARSIAG